MTHHTRQTAPTQFVEINGIRFPYGKKVVCVSEA
jgi:hypothetical protein